MNEASQGVNEEALRLAVEDLQREALLGNLAEELGIPNGVGQSNSRPRQTVRFMVRMYPQDKALVDALVAHRKKGGLPRRCSQSAVIREAVALLALRELGGTQLDGSRS